MTQKLTSPTAGKIIFLIILTSIIAYSMFEGYTIFMICLGVFFLTVKATFHQLDEKAIEIKLKKKVHQYYQPYRSNMDLLGWINSIDKKAEAQEPEPVVNTKPESLDFNPYKYKSDFGSFFDTDKMRADLERKMESTSDPKVKHQISSIIGSLNKLNA